MIVLGINGGLDGVNPNVHAEGHDSAAVLLRDGKVVAAFEEERLTRIKHTGQFPSRAIRRCLDVAGLTFTQVDRFALNVSQHGALHTVVFRMLMGKSIAAELDLDASANTNARAAIREIVRRELGATLFEDRVWFVKHHVAHAFSAFGPSGFQQALVVTFDGIGEGESGYVARADHAGLEVFHTTFLRDSLGALYGRLTALLGFDVAFDEYKVMGLAPYGNPAIYRHLMQQLYTLESNGVYRMNVHYDPFILLCEQVPPRQPNEPITQRHKDLAAALQEALETIVFHVLRHYRAATHLEHLCLAGGVAHNCTLTGKILRSGLFSEMFVQPSSHDAGGALGAALYAHFSGVPGVADARIDVVPHLYLGSDVGDESAVKAVLARWGPLLQVQKPNSVTEVAARLLANGSILGWVQGRAEFGPRALGNRSILADPRPAENKDIINAMVKKREAFRPFAPAVLAEYASEYFEIPPQKATLSHMTYALEVKPAKRGILGAVTHVDGSARLQTVSRRDNARFWELISAFSELTGVHVLLNTSFNNNAEPIVDSIEDAVVCFLTTGINYLVAGDFLVSKGELTYESCAELVPSLREHVALRRIKSFDRTGSLAMHLEIATASNARAVAISRAAWEVLEGADSKRSLREILGDIQVAKHDVFGELMDLWSRRWISFRPSVGS